MARAGWSTSNFLRGGAVATAVPLTIAAWAKTSITGSQQHIAGLFASGSAFNRNSFRLLVSPGDVIQAMTGSGASTNGGATTTTITAGSWFHACGVFTSATSRAAYLNGGGKGTGSTNLTPAGIDRTSVGLGDGSAANTEFAPSGTGSIAEVGVWDIALSDAEVALLSTGVSPTLVQGAHLIAYWPLLGYSPEINLITDASTLAVQGSLSIADGPPLINAGGYTGFMAWWMGGAAAGLPAPAQSTDTAGDAATPDEIRRFEQAVRDREQAKQQTYKGRRRADERLKELIATVYRRMVDKEPDVAAEIAATVAPGQAEPAALSVTELRSALVQVDRNQLTAMIPVLQRLLFERRIADEAARASEMASQAAALAAEAEEEAAVELLLLAFA